MRQNFQLAGISITGHEFAYKNSFYHSVFDTPDSINIKFPDGITESDAYNFNTTLAVRLQKLITSIAQTIYSMSSDKGELNDQVDLITLNKLIYCYYENPRCDFFKSILTDSQWTTYLKLLNSTQPDLQLSFYTGVNDNSISGKWISSMLMRYFTRNLNIQSLNSTECAKNSTTVTEFLNTSKVSLKQFSFVNDSLCIASGIYAVSSRSPAFEKFDDGVLVNTDKFSAWTESSWASDENQMRIFMFPNDSLKILTIVLGLLIFLSSIGITYYVNKFSNKWFLLSNPEQTDEFFE